MSVNVRRCVVFMLALLFCTVAVAGPKEDAIELSKAASEKARVGEFNEAVQLLRQAYEMDSTAPVLLYNMARVYERMGDKLSAKKTYEQYILAEKVDQEGIRLAQGYLATLMATLPGRLMVESAQEGALVLVNGKTTALIPMEQPVELPAGTYEVALKLCGFSTQMQTVTILGDELTTVRFILTNAPGTLVIDCAKPNTTITLDGELIGTCPLQKTMPIEVGAHQAEFKIGNRPPKVFPFDVNPYQVKTISFK